LIIAGSHFRDIGRPFRRDRHYAQRWLSIPEGRELLRNRLFERKETFGGMFRRASMGSVVANGRLDKVTSAAPGGGDLMFGVCRRQA
ncbi:hypothetical protein, partial [Mesorhizobium sp. M7A.F.Ca.CA.004.01.1.1]|uniref:hypothetical protein n=1 Tax=Mesorhizobium sp. M7A.F.Ca.CA.004.01.1.1 TaxID=2496689 RepID=UPI0019D1D1DF